MAAIRIKAANLGDSRLGNIRILHDFSLIKSRLFGFNQKPVFDAAAFRSYQTMSGGASFLPGAREILGHSVKIPLVIGMLKSSGFVSGCSSGAEFGVRSYATTSIVKPEKAKRKTGLKRDLVFPVTNFHNENKGHIVLAGDIFDQPIRKDIVHQVVLWQLAKRRQGTHSTKTISEVSGTGKKPWRQKGTGRARHGTLRGPQFRGGCVMHGPKPRSYEYKLNKRIRRLGLQIALSARAAEKKLLIFEDFEIPEHKTKYIANYKSQMEGCKKVLMVDGGDIDKNLLLATKNLYHVNVLPAIGLNVYSILQHDTVVMSRDAVNRVVERLHTPINR